jgi:hypothetical protein
MNFMLKTFLSICVISICCFSCQKNSSSENNTHPKDSLTIEENAHAEKLKNLKFYFGQPVELQYSDYVIVPVNTRDNNTNYKNDEIYGSSSSTVRDVDVRQWNLVFLNVKDSSYHLLTENEKWLIEQFYTDEETVLHEDYDRSPVKFLGENAKKYIFYTIRKDGIDEGKDIGSSDPLYLYVSDRNGKNLKQLSPDYYSLTDWHILKQSNQLILHLWADTDKDKNFDYEDEEVLMQLDLNNPDAKPQRILSPAFEKKLREMFLKRVQ